MTSGTPTPFCHGTFTQTPLARVRERVPPGRLAVEYRGLSGIKSLGASRCLAAFHVYVHLAVYAALAKDAFDTEKTSGSGDYEQAHVVSAPSAFRRALYLGGELVDKYGPELGPAGRCLVEWLNQCLELTSSIPEDSRLRAVLILERYRRELKTVESYPAREQVQGFSSRRRAVSQLVAREIKSTRQVLSMCHDDERLEGFDREVTACLPEDRLALTLADVPNIRRVIERALSPVVLGDDCLEDAARAHQIVEAMVDGSTTQLMGMLSTPTAGAAGEDEAFEPWSDKRSMLLQLTDVIGEAFGTEEFCLFLFSIVRMHAPKTIVELGTGLGTSAFWMALATKMNGVGHVWTVDDLSLSGGYTSILAKNEVRLGGTVWSTISGPTGMDCMVEIRRILEVEDQLTFVQERINLEDLHHFDAYPFQDPVDLLFSDFNHDPLSILEILGHFLPRMAGASSVFIDGASTTWSSYLLLEDLIEQLNRGAVPALLQDRCTVDLGSVMKNRRIVLVHLTERKAGVQNSTAWLKIEPVDLQPHPVTSVRELTD